VKFFDAGQRAEGFIAIGQEAVGVIAIGQVALGFIAIGQMARGVFVVGQLAVGVVAVGQLALGVWGGVGMMAITGRWVKGLGLAIWPKRESELKLPKAIELSQVKSGQAGFVEVDVERDGDDFRLVHDSQTLDVTMSHEVREAARSIAKLSYRVALVRLEQKERIDESQSSAYREAAPTELYLDASKIIAVPRPEWQTTGFWTGAGVRSFGIAVLAAAWFVAVAIPFWNRLFASKTTLLPDLLDFL